MVTVDNLLFALTFTAALGCGLIAGLFFAFSVSVMRALARLPAAQGMAAMQAINVVIINPIFLVVFLGTAAVCVFLIIAALLGWQQTLGTVYLLTGSVLYLVGSLLVTMGFNVPMNESLASVTPTDPDSASLWAGYLTRWTAWNHIRTVAALVAAASLTLALCF
jgi:uncharacterized membrane protein